MNAKELATSIIRGSFGDDLERAEAAFRGWTKEQLSGEYGRSGKSAQQILDEYRLDRENRKAALEFVMKI